jgi:L-ascorbate metabolism protein UlaG (beta-lactamase superfamily)
MRITKFGHAAIRIDHAGRALVIDPGSLTEPEAVDHVEAVLVTHEHGDHLDLERLRRCEVPVYTGAGVAALLSAEAPDIAERVQIVTAGDSFVAAGMRVGAYGEQHALIHEDIPRVGNTAFLVEDEVFHPGDSFTSPPHAVPLLCVPVHAPWMRLAEAVDFARAVASGQVLAIHDGFLNQDGLALVDRVMSGLLAGVEFRLLTPGSDL